MNRLKVGLLVVVGALLCGLVGLFSSIRAANRVRKFNAVSAAALEASVAGQQILVEGTISDRNPVRSHGFVAYVQESREVDEDGNAESWSVTARVTPPLLLELPDGLVQVGNEDYDVQDAHTIEGEGSFDEPSTTRYRGLAVADPVLVVGAASAGPELPQIEADFVARGTREEYIARRSLAGTIFCAFSVVVAVAGGLILLWDRVAGLLGR